MAPSGTIKNHDELQHSRNFLEAQGFNVKIFPTCYKNHNGFAGGDEERIEDLHAAFLDKEVKAILCARGGYGALRILDKIDYNIVQSNPKIFAGLSDVTLLLAAFYTKCSLKTYHSQMALKITKEGVWEDFVKTVNGKKTNISPNSEHITLQNGGAQGILWGGNLTSITTLFGSNPQGYMPKENILLFLEDINEPIYKIDRMLTQILRNTEFKGKIVGMVYGEFTGVEDAALTRLLKEFASKFNVPAHFGYNISHNSNNITVPFGQEVKLKENGEIIFLS